MPEYSFRSECGKSLSLILSMRDDHPDRVLVDSSGKRCYIFFVDQPTERSASDEGFDPVNPTLYKREWQARDRKETDSNQYPYVSCRNQGLFDQKDAPHVNTVVRGVPQENVPVVLSKKHENELRAKYGLDRE